MTNAFTHVDVFPSYSRGFIYSWVVSGSFNDSGPWKFIVQEGQFPDGPWRDISPVLENVYMWKEDKRDSTNKSNVLYFRVVMTTPDGEYISQSVQPYGTLSKRDFLLAREIMRQSVLHSRGMAGVMCQVYLLSTFGPKCSHCIDPVTGEIRDSHCRYCYGTGRDPAYNGPYDMWAEFSEDTNHQVHTENTGTVEQKDFQVRVIGNPCLKHGDVIIVPSTDKRYYINAVAMTSEIRRVPILQTITVSEAPQTDKIYDL